MCPAAQRPHRWPLSQEKALLPKIISGEPQCKPPSTPIVEDNPWFLEIRYILIPLFCPMDFKEISGEVCIDSEGLEVWGRSRERIITHRVLACMWSYVWDKRKESVFLYEFCSKVVYSIHISLIPFGLLERYPFLSWRLLIFQYSLSMQISQSTWIWIHLNICLCVLVLNTEYPQATFFSALCS